MSAFEGKLADWAREILADSPELATQAGVSEDAAGGRYADRLDDRSQLAVDARRSAALRRYAELRALNARDLNDDETRTYAVLNAQFEAAAEGAAFDYGDFSPMHGLRPYVLNQLDSAFLTLPVFLDERHPIASTADADAYLARLSTVAAAIDGETARARTDAEHGVVPPYFIIDATVALLDRIASTSPTNQIYFTSLQRKLDALVAAANANARPALEQRRMTYLGRAEQIVRERIIPAHQRAAAALRAIRARSGDQIGVSALPRGAEFYAAALRIETTTELTPAQIHRVGLDRVRALQGELDIALRRVGLTEGPVGARLAQLTADPRYAYPDTEEGRAQLLADVQARVARVMERAPQWFGRLPEARLEVRRVPVFAEATQSGAYYNPPSLDGRRPGIYYINMRNLAEMTRIDLPTQDYHEAVPGHHFQIALAQEQTNLPLLRRLMSFNAYSEGWGLYAEQLADEQSFYDGDPVGRLGYLRWQLWRAARLVVDTGIHSMNWSRQQAIDYLLQTTGDTPGVVVSEVDRYIVWPGQACGYEIGRREIARMRENARNQLGPDFDLRGFHDAVLLSGETPLSVLGDVVQDWIPEQRRLAERERRRR
jgi:uncharacterized protein (DUF885 family)